MKIKNILYLFLLISIAVMPYVFTMEEQAQKQIAQTLHKPVDPDVARFLIAMSAAYPPLDSEGKFTGKINFPAELVEMIARTIVLPKNNEALLKAVKDNDQNAVKQLLKKRYINVNIKDEYGENLLTKASMSGECGNQILKMLLEKGANPNIQNDDGWIVLAYPAHTGDQKQVEILLNGGANPNMQDEWGFTALTHAAEKGYSEIVKILLEKGANINHQNLDGDTALHFAVRATFWSSGDPELVKILLDHGADINMQNKKGITALDDAQEVSYNKQEIIELLSAKRI